MKLRRGGRWPLGLLFALVAMMVLAGAGSATLPSEITPTVTTNPDPCPPASFVGRKFCLVMSTYNGVSKDGGLRIDLQLWSFENSTLTRPTIDVAWLPWDQVKWISPKPTMCSELANPRTSRTDDTLVSCAFPNIQGLGKNDVAPRKTDTISLFFDADVSADLQWIVDAFANESGNDPANVPNTDVRHLEPFQGFGDLTLNQAISFGAPGATVELGTLPLGNSRLEFTAPAGTPPFQARFAADPTTAFCFGGLDCKPVQLTAAVAPGGTGLMISTFTVTTTKPAKNARVIHRYDAAGVTAIAGSKFQAGVSYVNIDGVRLTGLSGAGLPAAGDYYVVNASASDKTFQISDKPKGSPITFPDGGTAAAARIRIIGNDSFEQAASCSAADLGVNVPSMFAEPDPAANNAVKICFGDNENGNAGGGW
jgi:hypothetical protein